MSFETFPNGENNERSHEELELRNSIQARLFAMRFGPDEARLMLTWIKANGERVKQAIDELETEQPDLGYLWETHPDAVLEAINEKLAHGEEYRKAA